MRVPTFLAPAVVAALLLLALSAVPTAAGETTVMNARCGDKDWHGEDNEFGSICMKFQEPMAGSPVPVQARIVLHHLYDDRDAAYFLISFLGDGTPFKFSNVRLTTGDGKEITLYKREDTPRNVKLFVDVADMPPAGTELRLSGKVDSCERGLYQLGALVQPFNYRWQRILMNNGDPADLYSFTQVGVNKASCDGGIPGLPKVSVPGVGAVAAVAAIGGVAALAARRRP